MQQRYFDEERTGNPYQFQKNAWREGKMNVKDRLTAHNEAGQGIINMDGVSDALEASARIRSFSPLIISRLTEYEDTGLYPDEINALKAENAALRERLEKAVELPAKVGEKIYMPWEWDGTSGIAELTVCDITLFDGEFLLNTDFESDDINFKREYRFGQFREYEFGTKVFTTREAALARLAELKGGKT